MYVIFMNLKYIKKVLNVIIPLIFVPKLYTKDTKKNIALAYEISIIKMILTI